MFLLIFITVNIKTVLL